MTSTPRLIDYIEAVEIQNLASIIDCSQLQRNIKMVAMYPNSCGADVIDQYSEG